MWKSYKKKSVNRFTLFCFKITFTTENLINPMNGTLGLKNLVAEEALQSGIFQTLKVPLF